MGSAGIGYPLHPIEGKTPASRRELADAVRELVADAWYADLLRAHAEAACDWILLGEDSLLTIGDSEDLKSGEPATELSFSFYLTVDWPVALAQHWLHLALARHRVELDGLLAGMGYARSDDEFPTLDDVEDSFIVVEGRIGHPDDDGVFWQLPEYDYDDYQALSPEVRALAEAARAGGPCACPYCAS